MNNRFSIQELISGSPSQIVRCYLRYVIIKCSEYVDEKTDAEEISTCTFFATCLLVEKNEHSCHLGQLISKIADTIGRDVIQQRNPNEKTIEQSGIIWTNQKTKTLAKAINMLDEHPGQLIVLHHVEMMNTKELSKIYNESIPQIRAIINEAEKELVKHLTYLRKNSHAPSVQTVALWLCELADILELKRWEGVLHLVLIYLAEPEKYLHKVQRYLELSDLHL